jgi:hypothetical protein
MSELRYGSKGNGPCVYIIYWRMQLPRNCDSYGFSDILWYTSFWRSIVFGVKEQYRFGYLNEDKIHIPLHRLLIH